MRIDKMRHKFFSFYWCEQQRKFNANLKRVWNLKRWNQMPFYILYTTLWVNIWICQKLDDDEWYNYSKTMTLSICPFENEVTRSKKQTNRKRNL